MNTVSEDTYPHIGWINDDAPKGNSSQMVTFYYEVIWMVRILHLMNCQN